MRHTDEPPPLSGSPDPVRLLRTAGALRGTAAALRRLAPDASEDMEHTAAILDVMATTLGMVTVPVVRPMPTQPAPPASPKPAGNGRLRREAIVRAWMQNRVAT